jgi:hypothetical protein
MLPKLFRVTWIGACLVFAFVLYSALSSTAMALVGAKCGGFAGPRCGHGEWCQRPPGACFLPDIEGTCAKVPVSCPLARKSSNMILPVVCGCDGKTYVNDCLRMRAKVSKAHDGPCYF